MDFFEIIEDIGKLILFLAAVAYLGYGIMGVLTMHSSDDVVAELIQHINTEDYAVEDDEESDSVITESDITVVEVNSRSVQFLLNETIHFAEFDVESHNLSDNDITIKSIQQVK